MMDLSQKYFDRKGNYRNILEMIRDEPEWSANRIQEGEKAIIELKEVVNKEKEKWINAVKPLIDFIYEFETIDYLDSIIMEKIDDLLIDAETLKGNYDGTVMQLRRENER